MAWVKPATARSVIPPSSPAAIEVRPPSRAHSLGAFGLEEREFAISGFAEHKPAIVPRNQIAGKAACPSRRSRSLA